MKREVLVLCSEELPLKMYPDSHPHITEFIKTNFNIIIPFTSWSLKLFVCIFQHALLISQSTVSLFRYRLNFITKLFYFSARIDWLTCKLLLVLVSIVNLGSKAQGTHDLILLPWGSENLPSLITCWNWNIVSINIVNIEDYCGNRCDSILLDL
jgi:hypothetical protein